MSREPLRRWAARRRKTAKFRSVEGLAFSLATLATPPYRRGRHFPLNSQQELHVGRWHYECVQQHPGAAPFTAPEIVRAYEELLREWYGEAIA